MQQFCYKSKELPQEAAECQSATSILNYPGGDNSPAFQQAVSSELQILKWQLGLKHLRTYTGFLLSRCHSQYSSFRIAGLFCSGDYLPKYRASATIQYLVFFKPNFCHNIFLLKSLLSSFLPSILTALTNPFLC